MPQASGNSGGILVEEGSPRSTISLTSPQMTSVLAGMNRDGRSADPSSTKSGSPVADPDPATETTTVDAVTPKIEKDVISAVSGGVGVGTESSSTIGVGSRQPNGGMMMTSKKDQITTPMTPLMHEYTYASYPNITPQPRSGYYGAYGMTPEPASPATHPSVYDVTSFLQQQQQQHGGFHPGGSPFLAVGGSNGVTTLSPTRSGVPTSLVTHGVIPPPSPLFPRINSVESNPGQPPVLPYMSPQLTAANSAYQGYAAANDEAWNAAAVAAAAVNDRNQNGYSSPHTNFNFPPRRAVRSYSIEETTMLPPAALEDPGNPAYSPYGGSQASVYSMQIPPWPYGGPDPYSTPASPLQPRPVYRGMYNNAAGQYGYAANSPGPPIQTTNSNKGPDGANLFIFHIPNHFTNVDMFHLFQPFGNLLSVRIMIEKETGRSRGFGFVSYDSPDSAALAIKELNGYAIGNKRLKVQHKQIRRQDISDREPSQDSFGSAADAAAYVTSQGHPRSFNSSSLPPSGPNSAPSMWYATQEAAACDEGALSNLGSISDALPDISSNAVVEEERTVVA